MITTKIIIATKLIYYFCKKHPGCRWEMIPGVHKIAITARSNAFIDPWFITFHNSLQFSHGSRKTEKLYLRLKIIAQHAN